MPDGLSPAGSVAGTLQEILTRKRLESRQAMLDQMAREAAELQKRDTESQMEARRGQSQMAMENLGIVSRNATSNERTAQENIYKGRPTPAPGAVLNAPGTDEGYAKWLQGQPGSTKLDDQGNPTFAGSAQHQMIGNFRTAHPNLPETNQNLGTALDLVQAGALEVVPPPALQNDRDLTTISAEGKPTVHKGVKVPPNQGPIGLNFPPTGGSGGGAGSPSLLIRKNYRIRMPNGSIETRGLTAKESDDIVKQGATVLGVVQDQVEQFKTTAQALGATREALEVWDNERKNTRNTWGGSITSFLGNTPAESQGEAIARQNAEVAISQLTAQAPQELLETAQSILSDPEDSQKSISQLVGEGSIDGGKYNPDEVQLLNELLNSMRVYARMKQQGGLKPGTSK